MTKRQAKNGYVCILLALLLLVCMCTGGRLLLPAFANTAEHTSALTDLQKDSEFNADKYPYIEKDYSIQVIQIAESTDGGLFVYTYQPCQKTTYLVATEINMSLTDKMGTHIEDEELTPADSPKLYGLTLINTSGVFGKYKVNDFTVSDEATRYYNIASIYREWIKGVDKETDNDNTKNAVSYAVGKLFKVTTDESGKISYLCKDRQTVQIINPVAGYLEYSNGFKFFPDWCHSHYVAFSTDWKIDELKEADVSYVRRAASKAEGLGLDGKPHYEAAKTEIAPLNGEQTGGNDADGFLAKKYEWKRIERVDDFLKDPQNQFTAEAKEKLHGAEWVLRFVETEIKAIWGQGATTTFWTDISEVTVLRLMFVSNGETYNLGAVSDKVTEGDKPDNTNNNELASLFEWLARITGIPEWVWIMLSVLIPLAIALPVLSVVFPIVGQVLLWIVKGIGVAIKYLFVGLWWLVCLPFKGIAALVRKIKERGSE